jgi:hypothetical protein
MVDMKLGCRLRCWNDTGRRIAQRYGSMFQQVQSLESFCGTAMAEVPLSNDSIVTNWRGRRRKWFDPNLKILCLYFLYLILPATLGPGVYSASNRNKYQKYKNNNASGE